MNSGVSSLTERKKRVLCASVLALLMFLGFAQNGKCASDEELTHASTAVQESWPPPPPPGAPVSVTDTIYGVLRHHRALRSMQENRQVLEHELRRAQAGFGPSIDLSGQAGGNLLSDRSTRNEDLDKQMYGIGEISGRLTQPIWDGFATRSRVRSALSTLNSVKARVFDTATTLALDGIIAHIDLLRQRKIYELSERNVAQHRAILAMTADRSSMGADTEADVTQAQSRLSRALSSLSEAQANLLVAEDTYSRLTGMAPPSRLDAVPMPPEIFSGPGRVFKLAEKHNPKILAYIQDVRTAVGDKELAESTFYPTINAEVGPTYSDRGGSYDRWVYNFDAVATMRWNIFNSGADLAERKAAMARIRQARQTMYDFLTRSSWTSRAHGSTIFPPRISSSIIQTPSRATSLPARPLWSSSSLASAASWMCWMRKTSFTIPRPRQPQLPETYLWGHTGFAL